MSVPSSSRSRIWAAIFGLLLIACGVAYLGSAVGWWKFNLFFEGWWALLIIIPCVYWMIASRFNFVPTAGVTVGAVLLIWKLGLLGETPVGTVLWPALLVLVGLYILLRGLIRRRSCTVDTTKRVTMDSAAFSTQNYDAAGTVYEGGSYSAVFGTVNADLRTAVINQNVSISAEAVFGSVRILLPANVRVRIERSCAFGGVENKHTDCADPNAPTVLVRAESDFGSVTVL